MNDPNTIRPLLRDREPARGRASLARISRLPLRSTMPGYLLAAALVLGFGGWVTWKVTRQSEAIRAAEARTPPAMVVEAPLAPPAPVLVALPPETTGGAMSQVTTTGAIAQLVRAQDS